MNKIIQVKDFEKSYGEVKAVKGITFYVEEGKLFSFLGPNGAGKSTTIDTLCTLLEMDKGEIFVAGFDLQKEAHSIRQEIGVVFQESVLDDKLTVRENLTLRAGLYLEGRKAIKKAVDEVVALISLDDFIHRPYGKLSGGQRRRADIGAALVHKPRILFLDEPTTGLDPQTRVMMWDTIKTLQSNSGMTLFLTTHYMEEAAESDYIIIIDHGEVAARGTPSELKNQFASDTLRIRTDDIEALLKRLVFTELEAKEVGDELVIKMKNAKEALGIIEELKDYIEDFEVKKGSMDDVFIGVTGREIR